MHISWCFDVKHVDVDARALSDHVYRSLYCPFNVLYLMHRFHSSMISYFSLIDIIALMSIGDILYIITPWICTMFKLVKVRRS